MKATRCLPVWLLIALAAGCTEHNPSYPYRSLVRCEGTWELDDTHAGAPELMTISIDSIDVQPKQPLPYGMPCARGTVSWDSGSTPVTMQFGTPNNPAIPEVWLASMDSSELGPFTWDTNARGFAVNVYVASQDIFSLSADPSDDWLFVAFDDAPVKTGDNRAAKFVRYVRAD